MKKIQIKIILSLFLITFITFTVPRLTLMYFYPDVLEEITLGENYVIGALITGAIFIVLANLWLNFMIVKRLKHLNVATKQITDGNFNLSLPVYGKDEISQLTHRFNIMIEALRENYYVNQSFMKDYAHEFKTPISIIKGYADLIGNIDNPEEMKTYAKIISQQSQALSELSQNILELSLLDKEQVIQRDDHFDISHQLKEIIQSMQPKWEEKELNLSLDLDSALIMSNKKFTYTMFRNLIDNAIKYAANQSTLSLSVKVIGDGITISISNEGETISKKELEKIFELFYRSNHKEDVYGHGVGLSIVKKIVDKLNYHINVKSDNHLTTFIVEIK